MGVSAEGPLQALHQVPLSLAGVNNWSCEQEADGELGFKKYLRWHHMN